MLPAPSGVLSSHGSTSDKYPENRAGHTTLEYTNTCVLLRGEDATHLGRSGAAAAAPSITKKLLDPFCGIDFSRVDVAVAVHAHLLQVVELSGASATAPEAAQLLQTASVQDVDGWRCRRHKGNSALYPWRSSWKQRSQ